MKKMKLLALSSIFLLISCGSENQPLNRIESLLHEAQQGFTLKGTSIQSVTNSTTNVKMYDKTTTYDYLFDNQNLPKVSQTIQYREQGKDIKQTMEFIRSEDGRLAKEFINYKNEVDLYLMTDENGIAPVYDQLFLNPFKLLFESDFIEDEQNKDLYHLNKDKQASFEFYTIATGKPIKDITFEFEGDNLKNINIISINLFGKAYDEETKEYVSASWVFNSNLVLEKIGETKIDSPKPNEKSKAHDEVENILKKVGDNFTLTEEIYVKGATDDQKTKSITYFDKDSCYRDSDAKVDNLADDLLFKKDEFKEDNLLYLYKYDSESQKWGLAPSKKYSDYNVDPHDSSFFIPKISEISPDLFEDHPLAEPSFYDISNQDAMYHIGNAFLPEALANPYFEAGLGGGAILKTNEDVSEIYISLPMYIPMYGDVYEFVYSLTYSNIGNTKLPIEL